MTPASATSGTLLAHEHSRRGAVHVLRTVVRFEGASPRQVLKGVFFEPWFSPRPITTGNTGDRQTIHYNGGDESYLEVRNLRPAFMPSGLPGLRTGVTARVTWRDGTVVGRLEGALWKADWVGTPKEDLEAGSVVFIEEFSSRAGKFFGLLPSSLRYRVARGFAKLHVKFAPYHVTLAARIDAAKGRAEDLAVSRELDCAPSSRG